MDQDENSSSLWHTCHGRLTLTLGDMETTVRGRWCEHSGLILMDISSTRPYFSLSRARLSPESWATLSLLTPEGGGDAGAAASHRETDAFHQLCQANGLHGTIQHLSGCSSPLPSWTKSLLSKYLWGRWSLITQKGREEHTRNNHGQKPWEAGCHMLLSGLFLRNGCCWQQVRANAASFSVWLETWLLPISRPSVPLLTHLTPLSIQMSRRKDRNIDSPVWVVLGYFPLSRWSCNSLCVERACKTSL